ncbi:hypothetical protein M0804_010997 [Polistes exclamans]|nr:hypothetical protein M0804_010997 [Polistes exclamans]
MSGTIQIKEQNIPVVINSNRNELALKYSLRISRGILRVIGGWPLNEETSTIEMIYSYFANILSYFLFTFILLPGLLRTFLIEKNVKVRLKLLGHLVSTSINATKYTILMARRNKLRKCMKHVRDDWKKVLLEEDYEFMMSHATVGRTLAVMSASFIYGAGMSYRTILPLSKGKLIIGNVTIRPLACPSHFVIFNEQESPVYELVFFVQILAGFFGYSVTCGVCSLATFLIMHVCGQLEILMRMMRDIVDRKDEDDFDPDKRIAEVIQHQIRAKNFVKDVEEILQYMCMFEILGCTSLVCLILNYFIMDWENSDTTSLVTYFIFLLSFTFNMFIFCYMGELLSEQGTKVAITSCTLNWYRLPTQSARSLVLIILASHHPIKIVAGKIMDMSLSNFSSCMKHIRDDWKKVVLEDDYESMMSHAKVGRTLALMSASFIYGAGMSYRTILPFSRGKLIIGNVTIRPLACPSYFVIFNEQESPVYELVFFVQILAGFSVYSVACGVCSLATFLIMHVCGQLEILMRMMRAIVDRKDEDGFDPDKRIAEVIQYQIRAKNFVKDVEEILQYMCMVEIFGCTCLVCLLLYYFIMDWENSDTTGLVTYFIFLLSFTFNMFIFCYMGELLSEQGTKVAITSCTLNWYRLPTKSARSLVLLILASNHPIKIVAGKLMDMSLSNFNSIIRTAVGYFNILRNRI